MKSRFFTMRALSLCGAVLTSSFSLQAFASTPVSAPTAPISPAPTTTNFPIASSAEQEASLLSRYQLALDQLSTGDTQTARVILEDSIRRYGPRPEVNLLLAYVLQREGNNSGALATANQTVKISPLSAAFSAQLQGAPAVATPITVNAPQKLVSSTGFLPIVPVAIGAPSKNIASVPQQDARLSKLESAMMEMVNAERAKAGLRELNWSDELADVARGHSAEMRDKNYFSHDSPTPGLTTHLDRYHAAGYESPRVIAENIFRAWGSPKQVSLSDVQSGHDALMNSPGHRANILYPDVNSIGIGIETNANGDIWITQMFLRR